MSTNPPLLQVTNLERLFPVRRSATDLVTRQRSFVHAVDTVSFDLSAGEILALVGESGCGKSTTGRLVVRMETPTDGTIVFDGQTVADLKGAELRHFRRRVQMIAQNPFEAFDPRQSIASSLDQALRIHKLGTKEQRQERIRRAMEQTGLIPAADFLDRYPHELSGGQLQRIAIIRATLLEPVLLVADEPVSMLDVSVRADILNQFLDLQEQHGIAVILITHDIAVARYLSNRIAVMYLGMFVETGPADLVIDQPQHPYTRALLSHTLTIDEDAIAERVDITGDPATPMNLKPGCRFANRCPFVFDRCRTETPVLRETMQGKQVACHLFSE